MTIEPGRYYRFSWDGGYLDGIVIEASESWVVVDRHLLVGPAGVRTFRTRLSLGPFIAVTPLPDPAVALAGALVADALARIVEDDDPFQPAVMGRIEDIIAAIRPPGGAR